MVHPCALTQRFFPVSEVWVGVLTREDPPDLPVTSLPDQNYKRFRVIVK